MGAVKRYHTLAPLVPHAQLTAGSVGSVVAWLTSTWSWSRGAVISVAALQVSLGGGAAPARGSGATSRRARRRSSSPRSDRRCLPPPGSAPATAGSRQRRHYKRPGGGRHSSP